MNLISTNLNKAFYGIAVFFMFCFNKINNFIEDDTEAPVRLEKVEDLSWREKYDVELIFMAGIGLIILLFLFAFCVVGQMDPYTNGGLI